MWEWGLCGRAEEILDVVDFGGGGGGWKACRERGSCLRPRRNLRVWVVGFGEDMLVVFSRLDFIPGCSF